MFKIMKPQTFQFMKKLPSFRNSESGVAAIEFALVVPIMLAMYMGTIEIGQVISVDKKISTIASSLGDLVARTDGDIAASTLDDYVSASNVIMQPYDPDDIKQRITSVYVDANGDTSVEWSVSYNGAQMEAINSSFTLPSRIVALSLESYVIISESETDYLPWGGLITSEDYTLYKVFYNLPRYGAEIELTGSSSVGTNAS